MRTKQIGQILVEAGDVTPEKVNEALRRQDASGGILGAILREMGACSDHAIAQALAKQMQVTEVQCEELTATEDSMQGLTEDFCLHEKLCPFELLGNMLCVVMGNPLNRKSITDIEHITHTKVKTFKAHWPKIHDLIERSYAAHLATMRGHPAPAKHHDEPLSLDLEGEVSSGPPPNPENAALDNMLLEDVPDIIPPTAPGAKPAGPTGILEIPADDEVVPAEEHIEHVPAPSVMMKIPIVAPEIKGLETLDSGNAEMVDVSIKRHAPPAKPAPAPKKKEAKVNVDLDKFDLSTPSETIDMPARNERDALDEIEQNEVQGEGGRTESEVLVALKLVPDSYFYAGSAPKHAPRSEELLDVIEALPIAQTLAVNIGSYERKKSGLHIATEIEAPGASVGLLSRNRIEIQKAPTIPMAAVKIGEGEFQRMTLTIVEDPLGEWDWKCASPGPLTVEAFEE